MGNHKEWRKLAKKLRRKRIRQKLALERENTEAQEEVKRLASPNYQQFLVKQQENEEFQQSEESRLSKEAHEIWLRIEQEAQQQWQELQKRLELVRNERTKQQVLIKEQWDKEQEKLKKLKLEKEEQLKEKLRLEQELQSNIESYITNGTELPLELRYVHETNPGKEICPFFVKTSACRFRNTCSRNHVKPTVSPVLVIRNFYSHYSLDRTAENEHGSDNGLEFELSEVYEHFKEFFHDVLIEMQKFGHVQQFKVCSNRDAHLRGNVYIEYESCREAILSYRAFHGRFYAGKQITVEFCNIPSWKSAICGLYGAGKCPKGHHCNFLHPFRNPFDMFRNADFDRHTDKKKHTSNDNDLSGRHWRWSESPERNYRRNNSEWDDESLLRRGSRRDLSKSNRSNSRDRPQRKRKMRSEISSRKRKRKSRSPGSSRKSSSRRSERSRSKEASERKSTRSKEKSKNDDK